MKAIVYEKSGPPEVLKLKDVPKPTPKDNEILVKIHAGTVTRGDVLLRGAGLFINFMMLILGFKKKKIPGHELAGEIEAVGKDVKLFKKGDAVFGTTTGLVYGANAQYVCLPEEWKQGVVAKKPDNLTFDEAAAVPIGGMTALYLLKKVNIQKGQKVLVYEASGSVGSYAVQIAKSFGTEVTGVCSTKNLEMVKSIGTDSVIDYKKEDFTKGSTKYDIVFDAVGKSSGGKRALNKNGKYVSIKSLTKEKTDNLLFLKELAEQGKIKPFIDRRYPLEHVMEAHRYVETGRKRGNVVVTVGHKN
jgi:NADPH:quinone reductase-like Zn-dependent oxidoreductase